MKKCFFLVVFSVLFMQCQKNDELSSAARNTISEGDAVTFEELVMLLHVKSTDSTYLVVQSIDSVNIYINNVHWSKINSAAIDTTKVNVTTVGNQNRTANKLNYLVMASENVHPEPNFNTAADYATYLNQNRELKPGQYVCMIESFQVTFNDQSTQTFYPFEYTTFEVTGDSRSAYLGEIELKLY